MFEPLNDELITIEAMIGNLWRDVDFIPPEAFVSPVRIVATTPVIGNVYGPILVKFDAIPPALSGMQSQEKQQVY